MGGLQAAHATVVGDALKAGFQNFVDQSATRLATATTGAPAAGYFHSTIVGRAPIPDISNDLRASFGVERIAVQGIMQLQNEFGPDGESVYSALNDDRGLIRFVGSWTAVVSIHGTVVNNAINVSGSYIEIVFYGTGLNMAVLVDSNNRSYTVSVDGGVPTSGTYPAAGGSPILLSRNYPTNQVLTIASELALGLHTVKILGTSMGGNVVCYGFEVINSNTSGLVNINTGTAYIQGQKVLNSVADSVHYSTGITGAKGGRVVRYLNSDGTVGQAFTAVNAASAVLALADHTNEEVSRVYSWREFGAARSTNDDFSTLVAGGVSRAAAFTLDDGTTSLVGNYVAVTTDAPYEVLALYNGSFAQFLTITFVGTGLDIFTSSDAPARAFTAIYVDGGVSIGAMSSATPGFVKRRVVSGLPYGTHTVKLENTNLAAGSLRMINFIVYQPKKPTIPATALELCDYNVMADYGQNNTAGLETIATGVLRKQSSQREAVYVGAWAIASGSLNPTYFVGGWSVSNNGSGTYLEYTFFGTGFEFRSRPQSGVTGTVQLQNLSAGGTLLPATVANFSTLTSHNYGGWVFSAGGFSYSALGNGSGFSVRTLPLGVWKVRITNTSTGYLEADALDIITPIHAVKSNLYADLQNTLPVGSCSLTDSRKTSAVKEILPAQKAWAQAVGVATTATLASAGASYLPVVDLSCSVKTSGGPLEVSFTCMWYIAAVGPAAYFRVYIDGIGVGTDFGSDSTLAGGHIVTTCGSVIVPVSAGVHKVDLYVRITSSTLTYGGAARLLKAQEL